MCIKFLHSKLGLCVLDIILSFLITIGHMQLKKILMYGFQQLMNLKITKNQPVSEHGT